MRKRATRNAVVLIAAAALASFTLVACGDDDDDTSSSQPDSDVTFAAGTTMADLNEQGSVTIGTKFDQPLFGLKSLDGDPEGFDVEIGKIIAAGLGISADDINWIETPSAVREEVISRGDVDFVVATYTINDERRERITFAGPYYVAGQDLMVAADNDTISGPEDLRDAGGKVCSVTGSTPSETIREYVDDSNIVLFDVYSKCADALRQGTDGVVAVTTDNVILLGLVSESPDDFKLVDNKFTEEPYGIGITKGDVEFCEFINQTLTDAEADGSYAEAWDSTAGEVAGEAPTLPEFDPCT
jgi:glutamate transport system substrate-binding protein